MTWRLSLQHRGPHRQPTSCRTCRKYVCLKLQYVLAALKLIRERCPHGDALLKLQTCDEYETKEEVHRRRRTVCLTSSAAP